MEADLAGADPADEGPEGARGPAGEDVGGEVDAEVDAADADYGCEEDGGEEEEGFEEAAFVAAGEDGSQG